MEYVYTSDGIQIPVPKSINDVQVVDNGDNTAWVAKMVMPSQIHSYYEMARNADVDLHWAEGFAPNFIGTEYDSDHQFRYDQQYHVDPDDVTPRTPKGVMAFIRSAYRKTDALVKGVVDVLTELMAGRIHLEGGDPDFREMILQWHELINVQDLVEVMAAEYWLSGNVIMNSVPMRNTKRGTPFFRRGETAEPIQLLNLADALLGNSEEDEVIRKVLQMRFPDGQRVLEASAATEIPMSYAVLDPLTLKAEGNPKNPMFKMTIDSQMRNEIRNTGTTKGRSSDKIRETLIRKFGSEFLQDVMKGQQEGRLDPKRITTFYNKKFHYEHWGVPPGSPAVPFIQLKKRMKDLNLNTISQAIAYIVLVKIGSDELPADPDQLKAISEVWGTKPRKNTAPALFQPHTTEVEIVSPPDSAYELIGGNIYENPNIQIAHAWGINLAVLFGMAAGGNVPGAVAAQGLRATIRRIVNGQMKIERWLRNEYLKIGRKLNWEDKDIPHARFIGTGLENYAELGALFAQAADRGLPLKYFFESLGLQFDSVVEQANFEKENLDIGDLFPLRGSPTNAPGQVPEDSGNQPGVRTPAPAPKDDKTKPAKGVELNELHALVRSEMEVE